MMFSSTWRLVATVSLVSTAYCLDVTPGSDCAALCLGGSNGTSLDTSASPTNSSDIVCENNQYHTSGKGIKFKNCVSCLQDSQATKGSDSDTAAFLRNIRYAVDSCIYSFPEVVSDLNSPCGIKAACEPLRTALTTSLTTSNSDNTYDYCTADGAKFPTGYWSCVKCLQSSEQQSYLSNFLIALKAGCQQKPALGSVIALTGQIFSDTPVNISEQSTNTTMPGDGGASATTMTMGTIVGIAVGGGLVFIGAICLFIVYCRKQRKIRDEVNRDRDDLPPRADSNASSHTAINPYLSIADHKKSSSINSFNYELQEKHMANADYYEEDSRIGRSNASYNFDPHMAHRNAGSALPTHPAYIPRAMSRQTQHSITPPNQNYPPPPMDTGIIPIFPRTAASRSSSPAPSRWHSGMASQRTSPLLPPPPAGPPPRTTMVPSISMPTMPRLRIPKKYSPPQIIVSGASPIDGMNNTPVMSISEPLSLRENRFQDRPLAGGPVTSNVAPVRDVDPADWERDIPIGSGKSTLYG
ncbi:hypothetical protein BDP55DRAFT_558028 [Colletotrichum godetiae]|uniref:LPXTG-domain-containing protein n=1 Tax=Colletotrichum godetiae TaxID=1209918 RepID=A0AAJ0AG31_9PEZI|nr:uncharacterized protein BDP55DRAFT_558028 [Colletotrichum godetiae]KAK1672584.1 hypothetical protein BDP55DRAFT_558028 [Colletotrichum godetiae]